MSSTAVVLDALKHKCYDKYTVNYICTKSFQTIILCCLVNINLRQVIICLHEGYKDIHVYLGGYKRSVFIKLKTTVVFTKLLASIRCIRIHSEKFNIIYHRRYHQRLILFINTS